MHSVQAENEKLMQAPQQPGELSVTSQRSFQCRFYGLKPSISISLHGIKEGCLLLHIYLRQ